jgi:hypothetical protein
MRVRVLVASCGQCSGVIVVYQNAENTLKGSSVDSGPAYLDSMSVCGAAQWSILSDSWSKSNSPNSTLCYFTLYNINSFSVNDIKICSLI